MKFPSICYQISLKRSWDEEGKQVIHPKQIAVVQEEFSPSPEKIKWAHELMAAFDEHQHKGKDKKLVWRVAK
uniref:Uncharacterized protein n=1 Tax=Sphaerodactylus townsendi TaxID=933632 RepID=A0ACB8FJ72_9SAUR